MKVLLSMWLWAAFKTKFTRKFSGQRGGSITEYALCLSLVALTSVGTFNRDYSIFQRSVDEINVITDDSSYSGRGECDNCLGLPPGGFGRANQSSFMGEMEISVHGGGSETHQYLERTESSNSIATDGSEGGNGGEGDNLIWNGSEEEFERIQR